MMKASSALGLVSNVLILVVILLIWRKLGPYLEHLCADLGVERFYHWCIGAVPTLIIVGIMWTVISFALTLVLKGVVK